MSICTSKHWYGRYTHFELRREIIHLKCILDSLHLTMILKENSLSRRYIYRWNRGANANCGGASGRRLKNVIKPRCIVLLLVHHFWTMMCSWLGRQSKWMCCIVVYNREVDDPFNISHRSERKSGASKRELIYQQRGLGSILIKLVENGTKINLLLRYCEPVNDKTESLDIH